MQADPVHEPDTDEPAAEGFQKVGVKGGGGTDETQTVTKLAYYSAAGGEPDVKGKLLPGPVPLFYKFKPLIEIFILEGKIGPGKDDFVYAESQPIIGPGEQLIHIKTVKKEYVLEGDRSLFKVKIKEKPVVAAVIGGKGVGGFPASYP
ncbi:MAG: hypothetical protein GY771_04940, partial [bacterium]|nr:hypothetical protein [bacterium]